MPLFHFPQSQHPGTPMQRVLRPPYTQYCYMRLACTNNYRRTLHMPCPERRSSSLPWMTGLQPRLCFFFLVRSNTLDQSGIISGAANNPQRGDFQDTVAMFHRTASYVHRERYTHPEPNLCRDHHVIRDCWVLVYSGQYYWVDQNRSDATLSLPLSLPLSIAGKASECGKRKERTKSKSTTNTATTSDI